MSATFKPTPAIADVDSMDTPTTWLPTLTSGPPDVPPSITALVWMVSLTCNVRPRLTGSRIELTLCMALTYPGVTAPPSTGPPTATMCWPWTSALGSANPRVGRPLTLSTLITATPVWQS